MGRTEAYTRVLAYVLMQGEPYAVGSRLIYRQEPWENEENYGKTHHCTTVVRVGIFVYFIPGKNEVHFEHGTRRVVVDFKLRGSSRKPATFALLAFSV